MEEVLVIGAMVYDTICYPHDELKQYDTAIGSVNNSLGGVGLNLCSNLNAMGMSCSMAGIVGQDVTGESIIRALQNKNVDVSHVQISTKNPTSQYMGLLSAERELLYAICDFDIMHDFEFDPEILDSFNYVVADACFSEKTYEKIFANNESEKFVDAINCTTAKTLKPFLNKIDHLKCNRYELEVLSEAKDLPIATQVELLMERGLKNIIVTDEAKPVYYNEGEQIKSQVVNKIENIVDITGAGDALFASYIVNHIRGEDKFTAINKGLETASKILLQLGAQ